MGPFPFGPLANQKGLSAMFRFSQSDGGRALAGFPAQLTGDCVARAIAHATSQPYGPIWYKLAFLEDVGTKRLYLSADNGISPDDCAVYLQQLGFTRVTLSHNAFNRFAKHMPWLADGRYLLNTPAHMTACVNGLFMDQWDTREQYVQRVWRLDAR
jgi:hypothetical protein